jgi:DNA-binding MarR family transcriptional regulator
METGPNRTDQRRGQGQRETREPITQAQSLCSYWLNRAERRVSSSFTRKLKACGLIASEWAAIRQLYGPVRMSPLDIARAIGMTKGGASKLVDRLVKKGLARKTVSEFDRRFRPVDLTERAEELVQNLARFADRVESELFDILSRPYRLLRVLKRVAQTPQKQRVDIWHVPRSSEAV